MYVDKYGVHCDRDGVWWLLQGNGATNAIGLPNDLCEVKTNTGIGHCMHDIYLEEAVMPENTLDDEAFEFFKPTPRDYNYIAFMKVPEADMFQALQALGGYQLLSCPIREMIQPLWLGNSITSWFKKRANSNILTSIVYGTDPKSNEKQERLAQIAMQTKTRILFVGEEHPLPYSKVDVSILQHKKLAAPIETQNKDRIRCYGAGIIKDWMRQ